MLTRFWIVIAAPALLLAQNESGPNPADLAKQIARMNATIEKLQHRVDDLEAKLASTSTPPAPAIAPAPATQPTEQAALPAPQPVSPASAVGEFLRGTSINFLVDTYYDYNDDDPIGRVNRLRAYDVLSNAFSLNQADMVVENAPDPDAGKRWGLRLDLQFGQATETLQGNPANEPRPDIYRNIFQAYGTYVAPLGSGLTVDVGKFASSLGIENNYTQDQINYSRSYWFNFLPFYHMGVRLGYQVNSKLALNYWVVNGTEQTEPFNNFKDQFVGLALTPTKNISWNVNYYYGQEHPDVQFLSTVNSNLPNLQGQSFEPIPDAPKGKLNILDTYVTWQKTPRLTLALEADYVIERLNTNSYPQVNWGGAGYTRYQLTPRLAIGARAEYMADGGLFSGINQALKETTLTFEQKIVSGFLVREEWRRDFSNQPYFYSSFLDILKRQQSTATIGMVWWFGPKKSPW